MIPLESPSRVFCLFLNNNEIFFNATGRNHRRVTTKEMRNIAFSMHFHLIEWMKILATFLTMDTNNGYDSARYRHLYNVTKYSFI